MIPSPILIEAREPWVFRTRHQVNRRALPKDFTVMRLDARNMRTSRGFYHEISSICKFPKYFGCNLDALDECLADLEWLPAAGYVVLIKDAEMMLYEESDDMLEGVLSVFLNVAAEWAAGIKEGETWNLKVIPFHVVLEMSENVESDLIERFERIGIPIWEF